ncbi:MAG: oligosaccharide repeat unit polymerase [Chitinivibrionales bacterium]|nr:oligosaccharide repeat unit polymerase [Chitinivibrionales bacterium]
MTLLYLCIFLAVIVHAFATRTDLFSPAKIFVLAYSSNLAVVSLQLSRYQGPWSSTTHMLFWGSAAMYIAGCMIARQMRSIFLPGLSGDPSHLRAALAEDAKSVNWSRFAHVLYFAASVYLFGYLVAVLLVGTIPILSENPDATRLEFIGASRFTNMAWFFGPAAIILSVEYLLFATSERRSKCRIGVLLAVVLVTYLTYLTRVDLFRALVFAALLYHYGRVNLRPKHLVLLGIGFVIAFVAFAFVRASTDVQSMISAAAGMRLPPWLLWAAQPYAYVVGNFWNMDYAFRMYVDGVGHYPREWGFELLRPFLGFIGLEAAFVESYGLDGVFNESIMKRSVSNSTNYVWHMYKDFGAIGLYLQTFIVGFAISVFYYNTFAKPTLLRVSLWCVLAGLIAFSVTTAFWTMWFAYMNLGLLAVAHGSVVLVGRRSWVLGNKSDTKWSQCT